MTAATILLSAFLLFQVQPLIAKLILPWFGGSAAVWTTCMLFFQLVLLAGYVYAHWLRHRLVHIVLLAVSLLALPILPSTAWKPEGAGDPLWRIVGLLTVTVGLPCFMLSSTSPLLQSWRSLPWRYFALSNAGSMAGLLTYPVLVEPWLSNRHQAWVWSGAYALYTALNGTAMWRGQAPSRTAWHLPERNNFLLWAGLAACGSALMLAVTNHLTQNIAAIPFLWILPLSLYLLSFILCFDSNRWYQPRIFGGLAVFALPALAYFAVPQSTGVSDLAGSNLKPAIGLICAAMFILLMLCHGELARARPARAYLTSFYLTIAAGGAIGGLFIAVVAPFAFNALYDLPILLSVTSFLLVYLLWTRTRQVVLVTLIMGIVTGFTGLLARDAWGWVSHTRIALRNLYGALAVYDDQTPGDMGPVRILRHGIIDHGEQFLSPENNRYPTTYYARSSGVGRAIRTFAGPVNAGVIGLGAGTLAAYARPGDRYTFYEIDLNVLRVAATEFTFLRDCPGKCATVAGDARLALEREANQNFDVLAVDAFSGDAIPVHLLTREAFRLYWRHLKPDGVLAVHVSNKYLALAPVAAMAAAEDGKQARLISYDGNDNKEETSSDWVLITSRPGFFELPAMAPFAKFIDPIARLEMWTDDFSNVYRILR